MFVETIIAPREDWESWTERIGLLTDPPEALVAVVAWESGDVEVTSVHVWESPAAVGDFFMERVRPIIEAEGEPTHKPRRHGEAVAFYLRQ